MPQTKSEKYAALKETLKATRDNMIMAAKDLFAEGAAQLFVDHPVMESFSWPQYTPYFCDGDPCEFSVCDTHVNGKDDKIPKSELKAADKSVREFVRAFSDDDMLAMFGDHIEVIVTKDGVKTEEYEHE